MTRQLLAVVALAMFAAACDSGPLPTIPPRQKHWTLDRFPTTGEDPLDLDVAVRRDNLEEVRRLLDGGADPNARWGQHGDRHPLQEAIEPSAGNDVTNRVEIVRLLLAHGADPNLRWCPFESRGSEEPGWIGCTSAEGMTPLIAAASFNMTEIVVMLLAAGADPRLKDWAGGSALDYAPGQVVFELISRALFPSVPTRDRDAWAFLQAQGSIGSYPTPRNATPLSRALSRVGILPPPPPPPEKDGVISPEWRFDRGGNARVRVLLRIGADPNERVTQFGVDWTPLALVAGNGHAWTARLLLQAGADPNGRWCVALDEGMKYKVRTKDPGCRLENGTTPLMQAASSGRADLIRVLLEHGADPTLTNWYGKSAADLAATDEIRKLLARKRP